MAYYAIQRTKEDPKIWMTDEGKKIGREVQELEGQKILIRNDEGQEIIACYGVVDNESFRTFCHTVYCEGGKQPCIRRQYGTACRNCYDNGETRQRNEGRYFVELP